ncbi:hypothetical protein HK102_013179, partial [Quaeritorhiza haematococci]
MRTLKEVAIISLFGLIASILVVLIVIAVGIADYPNYAGKVTHHFINWDGAPASGEEGGNGGGFTARLAMALGTIAFSFGGNFVYPEVELSMTTPQAFPTVLSSAMIVITVMYLATGVVGYGTYGDRAVSPILQNLPPGLASTVATILITAHVILACPLLVTTLSLGLERRLGLITDDHISQGSHGPDRDEEDPEERFRESLLDAAEWQQEEREGRRGMGNPSTSIIGSRQQQQPTGAPQHASATSHPNAPLKLYALRTLIMLLIGCIAISIPFFADFMTL